MSASQTVFSVGARPPTALGHAAAVVRVFQVGRKTRLGVVVKASFQIAHKRPMVPIAPIAILEHDVSSGDPRGALERASEVAPYLARADVLLSGRACARNRHPAPLVPVRMRVGLGSSVLLDKTLHVYGDPIPGRQGAQPFVEKPIRYELAVGGPADPDNPAGVDPRSGGAPSIIDPKQPRRAGGFGPLAPSWPERARALREADRSALDSIRPTFASSFDWTYFQAAPADQRMSFLSGREWVLLEGFHPEAVRVESWLPGPIAQARVVHGLTNAHEDIALACDMLVIDAQQWTCSLVWRGSVQMDSDAALLSARVSARVVLPGEEVAWDDGSSLPFQPKTNVAQTMFGGGVAHPSGGLPFGSHAPAVDEPRMGSGTKLVNPEEVLAALRSVTPFEGMRTPSAPPPSPSASPSTFPDWRTGTTALPPEEVPAAFDGATPFRRASPSSAAPPATPVGARVDTGTLDASQIGALMDQLARARSSGAASALPPPPPPMPMPMPMPMPVPVPASPPIAHAYEPISDQRAPARDVPAAALPSPAKRRAAGKRAPSSPSAAPLVPPRRRRPAKVKKGGLGASFLGPEPDNQGGASAR